MPTYEGETGSEGLARLPQRSVLADEVYEILRDTLLSRRITPGARLNLDALARELQVSNTPVRQALARLEADGLVIKEPYRGFLASPLLDSTAIAELYDYRLVIEPVLAARAAERRSADGAASLLKLCDPDEVRGLATSPDTGNTLGVRDLDLHCAIAKQAGNRVIADNMRTTMIQMSRFAAYHKPEAAILTWEEHLVIARAIAAEDSEAAAAAMVVHLQQAQKRLGSALG